LAKVKLIPVNLVSSELNNRLSALVHNRIFADRFYITGKVGFWRCVGVGVALFGTGAALGIAFYGYSYITENVRTLDTLSSAFSKALSGVQLRATAEGNVRIEPRELTLARGQTISLDGNSRVLLDPTAKVRADGEIKIQTPSISVPQSITPRSPTRVTTITNFTVFKSVPFEKGTVMTGWNFLTSVQERPTSQYCYYTQNSEAPALDAVVDIAHDEVQTAPKTMPNDSTGFDMTAAFKKCVWFKSEGL
jgi:hypothetical protein